MKYNHSAMRQRFMKKQKRLETQYRKAGMTEEAIHEMQEFDLSVFRSDRNELAHKAEIEEMIFYDRLTGESHYIDMDELPANAAMEIFHFDENTWVDDIENRALFTFVDSLSADSKRILFLMICGYTQLEIAGRMGISQSAISQKISVLEKRIKNFI